jgi:hypothetical protein
VTVKKGSGLAEPISTALNGVMKNGDYQQVLNRWIFAKQAGQNRLQFRRLGRNFTEYGFTHRLLLNRPG